ncbi:MAG: T9SS type A sorting domain-containing protein [Ignavibacterium sp.]|nr:MAG: T9SS type A sorting domain-containing protein [Ignavibacterium sp.]
MFIGGIQGTQISNDVLSIETIAVDWTQFSLPINYNQSGTPDWGAIIMRIDVNDNDNLGGIALVDDLEFGAATDVDRIVGNTVSYSLKQNYPNPFNLSTLIEYSLPKESFVELKVYDILGNEVSTLVSEQQPAGVYRVDFNANNNPAGLYFARLTSNEFTKVIKMTLLK